MERAGGIKPQRFYGLDHLRALAIIMVFAFHYCIISGGEPSWLYSVSQFGWTGVDLFFVLSGFLIASQIFEEIKKTDSFSYRNFFIKRCFRILPAYWLVVAIYFCVLSFHEREALPQLWKFLTFTQNIGLNIQTNGTFSHAWSLCVEEHFYFLLPLTLLLLLKIPGAFKNGYWLLPLLFVATIALRYYSFQHFYLPQSESPQAPFTWYQYIYYPTWCRLDGLVMGVSIAALYQFAPTVWNRISKLGNWLLIFALAFFGAAYVLGSDIRSLQSSVFGFSLVAIAFTFLLMAAISPYCFLYRWKSSTTAFIAAISYSVYLTHKGIIHVTKSLLPDTFNPTIVFLICLVTCAIAAYLLHASIERMFLKWRNKLIKRKKLEKQNGDNALILS